MQAAPAAAGRERLVFLALFLVFYTTDAASGYFMIYLRSIGYDTLQMGVLTSLAALLAIFAQPYIGRVADRAAAKNTVLVLMLVISAALAPLMTLSRAFLYMALIYTGFTIARNIQRPLVDAMTLEYTAEHNIGFGAIRTMGCIGYAVMAAIAGRVSAIDPRYTFPLYSLTAVATLAVVAFLPRFRGRQTGKRVNPLMIFKNRTLLQYTLFAMVFTISKSFFHQYFSIYYTGELGGPASLYGLLTSLSALTEIPFVFFLDRLLRRLGTKRMMILAGFIETLRWLLTALLTDPYAQLAMHTLLGSSNMVMALSMTIFVNGIMPPETKATGQATYAMMTSIGSLMVGNLLGGALGKWMGLQAVFLLCVAINVVTMALFLARRGPNHRMDAAA